MKPLAAMLRTLDRPALAELEHALALRLNRAPTAAERRWEQLGVLATLINGLVPEPNAEMPTLDRSIYEQFRATQAPDAPDHRTLVEHFGSWRKACRAAYGLLPDGRSLGPGKPWPSPALGRRRTGLYTLEEMHRAIERCALELGRMPGAGDYKHWSTEKKRRLRETGSQARVPTIDTIYRQYPHGDNRWRIAVADAHLNEVAIAVARARKLLGIAGATTRPDEPLGQLQVVADDALRMAGFQPEERPQIEQEGFGWLPLGRAAALAQLLEGSFDWLVGRTLNRGVTPTQATRFDPYAFAAVLAATKVTAKCLREELDLASGPYRDLANGKREPLLAELVVIATLLQCDIGVFVIQV